MTAVAFDTETRGLNWWDEDERAFLGTWADKASTHHAVLTDDNDADEFAATLAKATALVGHNLKFDIHQTRETIGFDALALDVELHDTDLLARVVHPELRSTGKGYGLKELGKVFIDASAAEAEDAIKEMGKAIGLRTMRQAGAYFDVWRAYPEVMEEYARQDARLTYDLFELMYPKLDTPEVRRIYDLEMAVLPILTRAEQRGIRVDQAAAARLKAEYEPSLAEVREYLIAELGEAALGGEGSGEALVEALLAVGVPLHKKTDSGKFATNKFALAEFVSDYPQIAKLEEYRTLSRFLTTYIGAVEGRDVVHADFKQFEAWTGRMSCQRPNMQNWPQRAGKEVRAVFVPREGHSFVVCDYDQIETRLLAYYLGDADFRQLIEDGYDAHAWVAAQIWPEVGPYEYFLKGAPGEEGEKSRKTARHTEFAIVYGAGARRVSDMNHMDPGPHWDDDHPAIVQARADGRQWPKPGWQYHEAKSLVAKIKSALPNYHKLNKRVRHKVETVGYINTLFGRKNVVKKDKSYVGLNALIQGSAADICKIGLVNVDAAVRPLGGTPLLVVHDEIVVEVPSENAAECLSRMEAAMCDLGDVQLSPSLTVSGSIVTTNYADA